MSLTAAWDDAAAVLGGRPAGGTHLDDAYASPGRSYHDTAHVRQVLDDSARLGAALALDERALAHVALAALAHDVVYDGSPGDDERASAAWARTQLLSQGVPGADADEVARLVLTTTDHRSDPDDLAAVALLDADLAVLGGSPEAYDDYALRVRQEYARFDDATWALGRTAVLRDLLAHEHLYACRPARERWEQQARDNLARELGRYA